MIRAALAAAGVEFIAENEAQKPAHQSQERGTKMNRGVEVELLPLDGEHVRAKINWREQEVGGGTLQIELTVRKGRDRPKSDERLKADARALAIRFARAFADTIEG